MDRERDRDLPSQQTARGDFGVVVNRRRKRFPEEFPDGPHGLPPSGDPAGAEDDPG
jgi:hypothetical protein